jgi:hypothetical protein
MQLSACAIYAGTSGTTSQPKIETKGEQFSRCLDKESPEECDKRINGATTLPSPSGGTGGY